MTDIRVTFIQEADLQEVGDFLHANLNMRFSSATWSGALTHHWSKSRPNFGALLRDGTRLVGVLCAIYSDQIIDGNAEKFCNPHSWCVLQDYRSHAINLVLQIVRQPGYHFTMLTPNPKVAQVFRGLKFKNLADDVLVLPNLPSLRGLQNRSFCESNHDLIATRLSGATLRDFVAHRDITWLNFLAFGVADDLCLVVYKRTHWKRLPSVRIIHVSNPTAFDRHRSLMTNQLLSRGIATAQVEARFLSRTVRFAYKLKRTQSKMYLSNTLKDGQVVDLYSELAALDV